MNYRFREFLRGFPTIFEFDPGDTGFFVDVKSSALIFMRAGVEVSRLSFANILSNDPEASFESWRRKFRCTDYWRPGRDGDD